MPKGRGVLLSYTAMYEICSVCITITRHSTDLTCLLKTRDGGVNKGFMAGAGSKYTGRHERVWLVMQDIENTYKCGIQTWL